MEKQRLDILLVERKLTESRARAQWLIRQGRVLVAGRSCTQPGKRFPLDVTLVVTEPLAFVSRGGPKLAFALVINNFPGKVADVRPVETGVVKALAGL